MESSLPEHHEDNIAGKGFNAMSRYKLVHKFIPMPKAIPIPDARAAVDKERNKLETTPAWQLENAKSKQEVILEAQRDNEQSFSLR